ncbi:MAG: hypothetical protein ACK5MT_21670 [Actinomycetales bacterium]
MTDTIVILTEQGLLPDDAKRILDLHKGEKLHYQVMVPHDNHRSLLVDVLDDLSLLDMRKLVADVRDRNQDEKTVLSEAEIRLENSLASLRALGVTADGMITTDDPLPALGEAASEHKAREIIVVTQPHAVEDTLHTDWASVARDTLGLPVLHLYAGTGYVG